MWLDILDEIREKDRENVLFQTEALKQQKEEYLSGNRDLEERLDNYENVTAISDISKGVLAVTDEEGAKACRRSNYRILAEGLKDMKCVSPVIKDPEEETVILDVVSKYVKKYKIKSRNLTSDNIDLLLVVSISEKDAELVKEIEKINE